MRTTVTLDDDDLAYAREVTGIQETGAIVRKAMKLLVAIEAGKQLAALGGTMPDLKPIRRRRWEE